MLKLTIACLCWGSVALAQNGIKPVKITTDQVPKNLKFRGGIVEGWKWNDQLGENVLLTTRVEAYEARKKNSDETDPLKTAELHAFHFVKTDSAYQLLWKLSDAEKECVFDITAEFIKDATLITDLDNDGIAEITVQYKLVCRSDLSPANMKLVMHEGAAKYALRGMMWLRLNEEANFSLTEENINLETLVNYEVAEDWEKIYGRYQSEKEFADAPVSFLKFARAQWLKHVKESFE